MTLALVVWLVMTVFPSMIQAGNTVFVILGAASGIAMVFAVFGAFTDEGLTQVWKFFKKAWLWALPVVVLGAITPNTETSWYMVGAYAAESVVTSDAAKEIGSKSKDLFMELIKRAKEEISAKGGEVPAKVTQALKESA